MAFASMRTKCVSYFLLDFIRLNFIANAFEPITPDGLHPNSTFSRPNSNCILQKEDVVMHVNIL